MIKPKHFILSFIFSLSTISLYAQSSDSIIENIKSKYQKIHKNIKHFNTRKIDISGESTEGREAIGYFEKTNLKLINVVHFGEMGKVEFEYYFDSEQLFFILKTYYQYNRPIYLTKKNKSENDTTVFNPSKTKIIETRYYFNEKKLIRWLDNSKKEVDLTLEANNITGQELMTQAYEIRDLLKNKQ